jgi:predicted transcriptional regulator YdeE
VSSQSQNADICRHFWKTFNQKLAAHQLAQGQGWKKYAITYNDGTVYRYFCGISADSATGNGFQSMVVPESHYLVFEHCGPTHALAQTLSKIYRDFLPNSKYQHAKTHIFHFEKYDQRFRWNHAQSMMEIWLPIKTIN